MLRTLKAQQVEVNKIIELQPIIDERAGTIVPASYAVILVLDSGEKVRSTDGNVGDYLVRKENLKLGFTVSAAKLGEFIE